MTDRGDKDEHTDRTQRHDWDKKERARDTEGNWKHGRPNMDNAKDKT